MNSAHKHSRFLLIALILCWLCPIAVSSEEGESAQRQALHEQVRSELYRLNPGWYNRRSDSWVDVINLDEDDADKAEADSHDALFPSRSGVSLAAIIMIAVLLTALATLITLVVVGQRRPLDAPAARNSHLRKSPGAWDDHDVALRAPRFMDLDLDEAQRADLLAALQQAIDARDSARMVVCAWAVRLVLLDRAGIIHLRPDATNRQLLRECRNHLSPGPASDALIADMDMAARCFEQVYFGAHTPNDQALREMIAISQFRDIMQACQARAGGRT